MADGRSSPQNVERLLRLLASFPAQAVFNGVAAFSQIKDGVETAKLLGKLAAVGVPLVLIGGVVNRIPYLSTKQRAGLKLLILLTAYYSGFATVALIPTAAEVTLTLGPDALKLIRESGVQLSKAAGPSREKLHAMITSLLSTMRVDELLSAIERSEAYQEARNVVVRVFSGDRSGLPASMGGFDPAAGAAGGADDVEDEIELNAPLPAAAPAAAQQDPCYTFRKTIDPKCDNQSHCKWVVGKGCQDR